MISPHFGKCINQDLGAPKANEDSNWNEVKVKDVMVDIVPSAGSFVVKSVQFYSSSGDFVSKDFSDSSVYTEDQFYEDIAAARDTLDEMEARALQQLNKGETRDFPV